MPQVTKESIADMLEHIAQLLEIKGEVVFKVRAYQNAARAWKPTPAISRRRPRKDA